ncbi:MAG: hypothetical protein DBX55_02425 [Verrucomicrobia bacterium]|nr:MAG: hypothetical protein DBX55_02425 [Verrucomicrobiota bacterium]
MENQINAANENKFTAATFSSALTAYSTAWKDYAPLMAQLDFIAPAIPVGRRFEFKRSDNAQSFYSESDDVRAIGSEFKRVRYDGESVNEKTLNKGLTIRVDHDEVAGVDWQERYVEMLVTRLLRNELRRAIAALDTIASSAASSKTWSASSNPDADIRAMLSAAANESGVRPNRLLFGEAAWDLRMTVYESQNNAVAFKAGSMTQAELAAKFLLESCAVISSRYQSSPSAKTQIAGSSIYAFYGQNTISKDEPSNLKRFYTPTEEGVFRVYCDEHAKYTDLTVEHYSSIIATSELGVRKITVQEGDSE